MNLGTAPRGGGGSRDLVNSGGGRGADSGAVPAAPRGSGLRRGEAGGAADPGACAGLAGPRAGGARPLSEGSNFEGLRYHKRATWYVLGGSIIIMMMIQ